MLKFCALFLLLPFISCNSDTTYRQTDEWYVKCMGEELSEKKIAKIKKEIHADEKTARLDELFQKRRKAGFNGSVLIAQKGVVLYEKTFGYAHKKDTLSSSTAFQLASLSKPFTAVGILKLQEAGKLTLDDSLRKFFPELPYKKVTLRDLLSHRSGLPNYMHIFTDSLRHNTRYPYNKDVIRWFSNGNPSALNRPDRSFHYNNTNYLLLASIIEKVSGMSYDAFMRQNVFEPIGMKHTFSITSRIDSIPITTGYQYRRALPKDHLDNVVGDKGIYSTARDIYTFTNALLKHCVLKKSTLEDALTPRSFEKPGVKNYGYGFRMHVTEDRKMKYFYHGGWWKGYNTMWWVSPKDDFVVIILSNHYNKSVYQMKDLLEILHGEEQSDQLDIAD